MRAPKASTVVPAGVSDPQAPTPGREQVSTGRGRTPELEAALGAHIRAARIAARMSQTALGAVVGISFQQVQKYELGKDRVAASTLQGFAAALGVHPGSFYGDEMLAPVGGVSDVKAAMRAAEVVQQIRDPRVLKQLLALAKVIAESQGGTADPAPPAGR